MSQGGVLEKAISTAAAHELETGGRCIRVCEVYEEHIEGTIHISRPQKSLSQPIGPLVCFEGKTYTLSHQLQT